MKITRREFIERSTKISAAALLGGVAGTESAFGNIIKGGWDTRQAHPNILLFMVDQQHIPPQGYGPHEGLVRGLKEILGFEPLSLNNPFTRFFPGYLRLRKNAVVMKTHYTASSACVPSRACIMTGSYTTGVDQTDGFFKSAEDVPWLDPEGTPTIGDWFRSVGYTTHYFGKWHVSDPDRPDYLEPWGFSDWENSCPDPHRGGPDNLGVYRDVGFSDQVADFLKQKGEDGPGKPWLVVGSLVNPHDNGSWPIHWQLPEDPDHPNNHGVVPWSDYPPPPNIPITGQDSLPCPPPPPSATTCRENLAKIEGLVVPLNPDGFPQKSCTLPPTFAESLKTKPRCQYDYSLKCGLIMKSVQEHDVHVRVPYPFQLQGKYASAWSLAYNQFYYYCQYLADLQLRKMLQALDDSGLAENTIVVFVSDHGEMAGAHGGMIQKWHNAYEEAIRVPMVISSPLVNKSAFKMREIRQPTSSIDILPTLLALAGYDEKKLRTRMEALHGKSQVKALAGADLSTHIKGKTWGEIVGPDKKPRPGVFFTTSDMISELGANADEDTKEQYRLFLLNVQKTINEGYRLQPGTITQPNNLRALCTGDWKIVRYVDPNGVQPDEWELYYLTWDPTEKANLVNYRTGEVRGDVSVPGMTKGTLKLKYQQLRKELARQEASMLAKAR